MPIKLNNVFVLSTNDFSKEVSPKGNFQIRVERDNSYYRKILEGTMVFVEEDYDTIFGVIHNEETECSIFRIQCDFNGMKWNGKFTKHMCKINYSMSTVEVTPEPDDYYSQLLPYMQQEVNILYPDKARPEVEVHGVRAFRKDVITVEITEPYPLTEAGGSSWVGYSVNDWIRGTSSRGYAEGNHIRNSLIWYIIGEKPHMMPSHENQVYWADYVGIRNKLSDSHPTVDTELMGVMRELYGFDATVPECYTLAKVTNYYSDETATRNSWVKCVLTYEREAWEGQGRVRGGVPSINEEIDGKYGYVNPVSMWIYEKLQTTTMSIDEITDDYFGTDQYILGFFRISTGKMRYNVTGGWVFNPYDKVWYRRPLNMFYLNTEIHDYGTTMPERVAKYGDGSWYSSLGEAVETDDGYIRQQFLNNNPHYDNAYAMYDVENGYMKIEDRAQLIESIIYKFMKYAEKSGSEYEYNGLNSKMLTDVNSPLPWLSGQVNEWRDVIIIHNSDLKRPESTEKASEYNMTFMDFMDMICGIANAGWAIDEDGEFYFEHKYFFDNGFSYDTIPAWKIINPRSIRNTALNKTFMQLSTEYTFAKMEMQKYENFILDGGASRHFNNTQIIYPSPCTNNIPDENKREVVVNLSLDAEYVMGQGEDGGLTMIKVVNLENVDKSQGEDVGTTPDKTGDIWATSFDDYYYNIVKTSETVSLEFTKATEDAWTFNGIISRATPMDIDRLTSSDILRLEFTVDVRAYEAGTTNPRTIAAVLDYYVVNHNGTEHGQTVLLESGTYAQNYTVQASGEHNVGIKFTFTNIDDNTDVFIDVTGLKASYYTDGTVDEDDNVVMPEAEVRYIPTVLVNNLYTINGWFNLEHVVTYYHPYDRSFKKGSINRNEVMDMITRPYIIRDVFFPFRYSAEMFEDVTEVTPAYAAAMFPYMKVILDGNYGNINAATINTMTGIMDVTVGFREGQVLDMEIMSWQNQMPEKGNLTCGVLFHRHVQARASEVWTINHRFKTDAIYKPLVFKKKDASQEDADVDDTSAYPIEEIGYDSLTKINDDILTITFTKPVSGEVYLLAFDPCPCPEEDSDVDMGTCYPVVEYEGGASSEWVINHNIGIAEVMHSIIWKDGKEVGVDDYERVDENTCILSFSKEMEGGEKVYLSYVSIYEDHVTLNNETEGISNRLIVTPTHNRYPLKPLVMQTKQIGYDYSILEQYLYRIGFSKEVVATIVVMQHQ